MCTPEKQPKNIPWHDLTPLSRRDILKELSLPLPWLFLSWALYASALWPLGAVGSFMFFLCALRLNHEAIHNNLALPRRGDSVVMHVLSALMLGSNHAEAWCHMRHHKFAMGPEDHEGKCGNMTALEVLRYGPRFPIDINLAAWRGGGPRWRKRILRDWVLFAAVVAVALISGQRFLLLHVAAMICAQCMAAFFAVWVTHQGLANSPLAARSQRGPLARAAYLMFYHREHHLFPKVPVSRLPRLAARLDAGAPGYAANRRPVINLFEPRERRQA